MATDLLVDDHSLGLTIRPPDPSGLTVLYLPGDRTLSCAPESVLDLAGHLALRTGAVVVCARYRPLFPEALEDVHAAHDLCQSSGPVAVAGQRAGAGLAAALLIRLRDRGATLPHCAMLASALLDLTLESPSLALNASADPTFDVARLRELATAYAAGTPPTNPVLSPLFANLHGLPPVQLLTAGTDPLLDDSLAFAARAARSGVTVDLRVHQDASDLRSRTVTAMTTFLQSWTPTRTEGQVPSA